jgi:hypothetical protein
MKWFKNAMRNELQDEEESREGGMLSEKSSFTDRKIKDIGLSGRETNSKELFHW